MLKKINMKDYTGKNYLVDGCVVRALDNLYVSTDINELFNVSFYGGDGTVATHFAETYNGKNYNLIYFYDDKAVRKIAKQSVMEHLLPDLGIVEETQANLTDLVTIENGKAMTTSLKVAEVFGKRHAHVMDAIKKLEERGVPNFRSSSYINAQNKEQPMYLMDRDGFSLLVMGFTGDKALDWKLKYIEAFNKMEKALLDQRNNPALPQSYSEALRALADEAEARQALAAENKVLAPKAEYHVGATKDGEEYYLREVARSFGTTHIQLSRFLVSKGVFRTRRFANNTKACGYLNRNIPRDRYVDGGYFAWINGSDGYPNKVNYIITQKGVHFIAELLYADGLIDEIPAWANLHEEAA